MRIFPVNSARAPITNGLIRVLHRRTMMTFSKVLALPHAAIGIGCSSCSGSGACGAFVSEPARLRRRLAPLCASRPPNAFWESTVSEELKAEAASLVALCHDLDWKSRVDTLRKEAQCFMKSEIAGDAIHSKGMLDDVAEWDCKEAILDLRRQASFQAAQELAKRQHSSDFDTTVSKLKDYILSLCTQAEEQNQENSDSQGGTWKAAVALIVPMVGLQGAFLANAMAAPPEVQAAADTVPSWLGPAVLGFPVASYLLFSLYRDKVNPYAKLSDWLFGLVAMFIVGNLITSATIGVSIAASRGFGTAEIIHALNIVQNWCMGKN